MSDTVYYAYCIGCKNRIDIARHEYETDEIRIECQYCGTRDLLHPAELIASPVMDTLAHDVERYRQALVDIFDKARTQNWSTVSLKDVLAEIAEQARRALTHEEQD